MRRRVRFSVAVGCLVLCTGCAAIPSVRKNEEISRRVRKDIMDFYENIAQAYYLLGLGYYRLHLEAQANKNDAASEQYLNNAVLYKRYYQDLMESVRATRATLNLPQSERQPSPSEGLAVTTGPMAVSAPPQVAPSRPAEKKPSLLSRLGWHREKRQPEPANPRLSDRPKAKPRESKPEPSEPKPSLLNRLGLRRKQS